MAQRRETGGGGGGGKPTPELRPAVRMARTHCGAADQGLEAKESWRQYLVQSGPGLKGRARQKAPRQRNTEAELQRLRRENFGEASYMEGRTFLKKHEASWPTHQRVRFGFHRRQEKKGPVPVRRGCVGL